MEKTPDRLQVISGFQLRGCFTGDQLCLTKPQVAVELRELAVLEGSVDQESGDRDDENRGGGQKSLQLIDAVPLLEVVIGHSKDRRRDAKERVAPQLPDDLVHSRPSCVCSEHFVRKGP